MLRLLSASALLLLPAVDAAGQLPSAISPGQLVRVQAGKAVSIGELVTLRGDTITIRERDRRSPGPETITILMPAGARLWLSTGHSRRPLQGLLIGALANWRELPLPVTVTLASAAGPGITFSLRTN
jgi:hypothetical protein